MKSAVLFLILAVGTSCEASASLKGLGPSMDKAQVTELCCRNHEVTQLALADELCDPLLAHPICVQVDGLNDIAARFLIAVEMCHAMCLPVP
jgi:hypothetical protein